MRQELEARRPAENERESNAEGLPRGPFGSHQAQETIERALESSGLSEILALLGRGVVVVLDGATADLGEVVEGLESSLLVHEDVAREEVRERLVELVRGVFADGHREDAAKVRRRSVGCAT